MKQRLSKVTASRNKKELVSRRSPGSLSCLLNLLAPRLIAQERSIKMHINKKLPIVNRH